MADLGVCLDQIALSGLEGCTVNELWEYVAKVDPPITLNDQTKHFLWDQITQCTSVISFYLLDNPKPKDQTIFDIQITYGIGTSTWHIYTPSRPFTPVTDHGDIKGSCASYNARKNITSEIEKFSKEERQLHNILERYDGNCLVLVGSSELRVKSLTPPHSDPTLVSSMINIRYGLLEVVGQSRGCGIFRTAVTKQYLKVDARTTFFHVKVLEKAGLIAIKNMKVNRRPMFTLFLKRFEPSLSTCLTLSKEQKMCQLLSLSPDHTLPTQHFLNTMKKSSYKRARSSLISKGIIEQVIIPKANRFPDYPESTKGLKLVKPYDIEQSHDKSMDDTFLKEEGSMGGANMEDDDDYDDGGESSIGAHPIVAELPLQTQAYLLIDSFGAEGISFPNFLKSIKIDKYALRLVSRTLLASSSIIRVIMDSSQVHVRTSKLISTRHSAKSDEVVAIRSELAQQKPGQKMQEEKFVMTGKSAANFHNPPSLNRSIKENDKEQVESHVDETGAGTSIVSSSQEMEEVKNSDDVPVAMETNELNDPIIYKQSIRQLKRVNMLNEYMERKRVDNGHVGMMRFIKDEELKEGRTTVIDRKTTHKLIQYMCQTKQLVLKQREIDLGGLSMEIKLYCIPTASEEEIQAADKAAEDWYQKVLYRRETRPKRDLSEERKPYQRVVRKKRKKQPLFDDGDSTSSEGEESPLLSEDDKDTEKGEGNKDTKMEAKPINTVSKFQRIKNFHYYLWILAHGFTRITSSSGHDTDESGRGTDDEGDAPYVLSELHYPWAKHVHQLPSSGSDDGYVWFSDVLYNMPLSLFFSLRKIDDAIISRYHEYFLDPVLSNTKLPDLPRKLRKIIAKNQNDVSCINYLIDQLVELKLVESSQGTMQDKSKLQVKLCHHVTVTDTRTCAPRRTFFLEEARSTFPAIQCQLNSLANLEMFWYQLHGVCMSTPIIIRAREKKKAGKVYAVDEHPLPYSSGNTRSRASRLIFDSKGFGAGGVPPSMFSHLSKNWVQSLPDFLTDGELMLGDFIQTRPDSDSYGPGMSLDIIPEVSLHDEENEDSLLGKRPCPPATISNMTELGQVKKRKIEFVSKPSSSITPCSGGKGLQRVRAKQVLKKAMKLQRSKEKESKPSLQSLVVKKTTSADIDELAMKKRVGERSIWFPHEDNFLLLGYIASRVYLTLYKSPVDICLLTNALHNKFKTSQDKTSASVRRRLGFMLKKKNYNSTITAYVDEILHELGSDTNAENTNAENRTYESILDFISQRYRSHDGHMITKNHIDLPSSIHELQKEYELDLKSTTERGCSSAMDQSSINQQLLTNLIIMCLSLDQSSYDSYSVFKQLENYPEHDLRLAVELLKSASFIKQKKIVGIPRQKGPLETQGFELSVNFHMKLETHYSPSFHQELVGAASMMESWYNNLTNFQAEGPIILNTEDVDGGTVATVIQELFSFDNPVKYSIICEPKFPKELFSNSSGGQMLESVLKGDGSSKDDEDIEGEEGPAEPNDPDDQRLQDISRDEQDEGLTTPSHGPPSSVPRCGVSTLLQVDEYAELKHCQVELGPSLNIGKLMDPVQGANVASHDDKDREAPVEVDFNEFTDICLMNLGYNDEDLKLAEKVYHKITKSAQKGISETELLNSFEKSNNKQVQDILHDLLNFKLVYSVGLTTPLIVSHAHSKFWMLSDVHGNRMGGLSSPWTSIGSGDINVTLFTKLERKVVSHIVTNPGISLESLLIKFKYLFNKISLLKLLKSLQLSGHVTGHTMKTMPSYSQTSLFSPRPITYLSGYYDDDDPSTVFFKATVLADVISLK